MNLKNKQIEQALSKALSDSILPEEVKQYLEHSLELKKEQVKMDINRYLSSLPVDKQKEALDEIYEWKK